jgi:hypothetical protein
VNGSSLTPFAWAFMASSMLAVTVLVAYCYKRILFDDQGETKDELRQPSDDMPAGR